MSEQRDGSGDRTIRVLALGVVRRGSEGESGNEILVFEGESPESGVYYRPLGGGVRFGEDSVDALRREFREKLEVELEGVGEFGTFEDVFDCGGARHHEVALVYEAGIAQRWPYRLDSFPAADPETGEEFDCLWKPVSAFTDGGETLHPEGLAGRL
ncbi:NUDIX domain-containing protein [Halobium salinum]|uniref:NUDIX domain-containing protein n=1 Tax=Halobium salinum TaxID=1364940 RepID=A0ABD5P8Q3_9EURY|nr:NUDIX domain-containing protein [Halobium salinum]